MIDIKFKLIESLTDKFTYLHNCILLLAVRLKQSQVKVISASSFTGALCVEHHTAF
jgi:hypothetical protein